MSPKLFYILFFTLYFVLHFARSAETEIYLDVTDCGNESISDHFLSITPHPALLTVEPLNFWFGGQISFTEVAQQIANNTPYHQFYDDLHQLIFVDGTTPSLSHSFWEPVLRSANNSQACGSILSNSGCALIYEAMARAMQNVPIFVGTDFSSVGNDILWRILRSLLDGTFPELEARLRIKFVREQETICCFQVTFRSAQSDFYGNLDPNEAVLHNFQQSFVTSKFINKRNNCSLDCPQYSKELTSQSCSCLHPHAGPFCQLQCNYDQMSFLDSTCIQSNRICVFDNEYYVSHCLNGHGIQVLKEPIRVFAPDLNSVNVSWLSTNIFNFYYVTITIRSEGTSAAGPRYTFSFKTLYIEDIPTNLTLTNMYLNPFTSYTLSMQFMAREPKDGTMTKEAGSANFTTIEVVPPDPPQIVDAILLPMNILKVNWILLAHCPGLITDYDVENWCNDLASGSFIEHGTLETQYDCRKQISSTVPIKTTLNKRCVQGGNLQVRIRIATRAGMSIKWSNTFTIKTNVLPWMIIIAASCGAFIIIIVIGSLGWLYYHKRKIEPLKDIEETLHGLRHRINRFKHSMRESLANYRNRTLPTPPAFEKYEKSFCVTPYEPSPLTSPTPCSVVNFFGISSDHYEPDTDTDILSAHYDDAILQT